jgi:hypothetical protein
MKVMRMQLAYSLDGRIHRWKVDGYFVSEAVLGHAGGTDLAPQERRRMAVGLGTHVRFGTR